MLVQPAPHDPSSTRAAAGTGTARLEGGTLRTRDADRTQQAILRAAMGEFSDKGLSGARIDSIADAAGVNKRLIYYYFRSKEQLFLAVLEQTYADIREAEAALHLESAAPDDAIRKLVAFTWNWVARAVSSL